MLEAICVIANIQYINLHNEFIFLVNSAVEPVMVINITFLTIN